MKASVEVFSPVDNACVSPRAAFVHVPPERRWRRPSHGLEEAGT